MTDLRDLPKWLSPTRLDGSSSSEGFGKFEELKFSNITNEKRTPFQRDIDIITFDSSFRRLAHKTQVALNPAKDFTRTRLTHSIEVSRIGLQAARILGDLIWGDGDCLSRGYFTKRCFEDAVAAACLVHDIGHPAFGHAGEEYLNVLLNNGSVSFQSYARIWCLRG